MTSQPMRPEATKWFLIAFPFLFLGMWILVTTVLGFLSGWFSLQEWYSDDGNDDPLLKLGWQSGSMGLGVGFNSCLTFVATRRGLSVRIWRIFGPFQRPLLFPWREITVEPSEPRRFLFLRMVRLSFGSPPSGSLKIREQTWTKLVAAAGTFANKI
ncbi:MAG: hypothetical protein ABI422_06330 [Sphingomicrobium sp.]